MISLAPTSGPSPAPSPPVAGRATAAEAVAWAVETFGADDLTLLCSGQDAVLVDLALAVDPAIEIAFIDTGFHFPETIETMERIARRYRPRLRIVVPWRHLPGASRPDFCCGDHKVEQLELALDGRRAWLSGLRRADGPDRAGAAMVETDRRGLTKINPIVDWTDQEVARYEAERSIIVNPLRDRGYPSIGCWPCTSPVVDGADARSGRWAGQERTECGIHW
ncbi:MAG: phosphoadenylyl-sulfate reductase [Acidimicrobiales bacterium]